MAGVSKKVRIVIGTLLAGLIVYYAMFFRITGSEVYRKSGYTILSAVDLEKEGEEQVIRVELEGITEAGQHLMFFSIHQNVAVYYGPNCIYSMRPAKKNAFTKTPGCVWNDIVLTPDLNGESLRVSLTPAYTGITYEIPTFYLGEKSSIVAMIFRESALIVSFSLLLIIVGAAFIGYVLYNFKNSEVDKNLGMLGAFAVGIGIWKMTDTPLMRLIAHGLPAFSLVPFMALMLVIVPSVLFLMALQNESGRRMWFLPCWISLVADIVAILMQYFNYADFRQTLWMVIATMVISMVIVSYLILMEGIRHGWNAKLRRNLIGFGVIALGAILDFLVYRFSGGRETSSFTVIGFLAYVVVLGGIIVRESGALMVAGERAESLENIAYHDNLTGLFNRSAFLADTDPYAIVPDGYVVVVMDLNNLKKCNDTLGHEKGDQYIKDSGRIIQETFGSIGKCYRVGGDEFYCLIQEGGMPACKEQKEKMDRMVEEYNAISPDIEMGIACGYARFDRRIDYDLKATSARADKLMYKDKGNKKRGL